MATVAHPDQRRMAPVLERRIATLKRPESTKFRDAFLGSFAPFGDVGMLGSVDAIRVGYVLAKIAKGIAFEHAGVILGDDFRWVWTECMPDEFTSTPTDQYLEVLGGALKAKWVLSKEGDLFGCLLAIHDAFVHEVGAIRVPSSRVPSDQLEALPWPKPR